jgi:hypothetical protein
MYFLNIVTYIKQILPPNWRISMQLGILTDSGKFKILKVLLTPFNLLINDFNAYRYNALSEINLSAQTYVIEHYLMKITNINYGIYLSDTTSPNVFKVNIPISVISHRYEISSFLNKIIPAGRKYTINYY